MLAAYGQLRLTEFVYIHGGLGFGRDSDQQQSWNKASTGDWLMQVNSYDYTGTKLGLKLVLIPDVSLVSIEVDSQNISNGSGFIRNNAKTVAGDIDKLEATAFTLNWTYRL